MWEHILPVARICFPRFALVLQFTFFFPFCSVQQQMPWKQMTILQQSKLLLSCLQKGLILATNSYDLSFILLVYYSVPEFSYNADYVFWPLLSCRIEAFNSAFREHMRYMDSITIDDLEKVVNTGGVPYSREEIMLLLQVN